MLVAISDGKVRLCVSIQLPLERKPYSFFTMLNGRSCNKLPYCLADSVCVSVVVGYALETYVLALECLPRRL